MRGFQRYLLVALGLVSIIEADLNRIRNLAKDKSLSERIRRKHNPQPVNSLSSQTVGNSRHGDNADDPDDAESRMMKDFELRRFFWYEVFDTVSMSILTAMPTASTNIPATRTPSKAPESTATNAPTLVPTAEPTMNPTLSPTRRPTKSPTRLPTKSPTIIATNSPTVTPTNSPTAMPTKNPTKSPSLNPTRAETLQPTVFPTMSPSKRPTPVPTISPTLEPTTAPPTAPPTAFPTLSPTSAPTISPSRSPTRRPTFLPTNVPTISPTQRPTLPPTPFPSPHPTPEPTTAEPSPSPTRLPTSRPTLVPTVAQTESPTISPTEILTANPTIMPTDIVTLAPTELPTMLPTKLPTLSPIVESTDTPTISPTVLLPLPLTPSPLPTLELTDSPTLSPTVLTILPSAVPTLIVTTVEPTNNPTVAVTTIEPTISPTVQISAFPTNFPTQSPTRLSTIAPTNLPTAVITLPPTPAPTAEPTAVITLPPTPAPTAAPTVAAPAVDILELVASIPNLDMLEFLIDSAPAGLAVELQNTDGITIFAPSNTAVMNVSPDFLNLLLLPGYQAHLVDILQLHVAPNRLLSEDLENGESVLTVQRDGETLEVAVVFGSENTTVRDVFLLTDAARDPDLQQFTILAASIERPDLIAENGVVHIINNVLLPKWAYKNTYEVLSEQENLSTLKTAIDASGLEDEIMMLNGTLLAPNNDAFLSLPDEVLADLLQGDDITTLQGVLSYHILPEVINFFAENTVRNVTTRLSTPVVLSITDDAVAFNGVVVENLYFSNNGVIFEISEVLFPSIDSGEVPTSSPTTSIVTPTLPPSNTSADPTILDIIANDPDLSQFELALTRIPELAEVLDSNTVTLSVFAPVNSAFESLGDRLELYQSDPFVLHLTDILGYHAVPALALSTEQLFDGRTLPTGQGEGEALTISNVNNVITLQTDAFSDPAVNASITAAIVDEDETRASNGVVHKIDQVLLPTWTYFDAYDALANSPSEFSIFLELLTNTGLEDDVRNLEQGTVLAPTNSVFETLGLSVEQLSDPANRDLALSLLTYLLLPFPYNFQTLGTQINLPTNSVLGAVLNATVTNDSLEFNNVQAVAFNFYDTGFIYQISDLLIPPL